MADGGYGKGSIQVLEGRDAVRLRPGMYIGGTSKAGLHHILYEIIDNSVDEFMNGHGSCIEVTLHEDGKTLTVNDDGRGIPVDIEESTGKSSLEVVFTKLHAGGKFDQSSYKGSGGLHGVGSSVTNFLSETLVARVRRDEKIYEISFDQGIPLGPVEEVGTYSKFSSHHSSGTEVTFKADGEVFPETTYDPEVIAERLEIKTYVNPGLKVVFIDQVNDETHEYQHDEGITEYLQELVKRSKSEPIHTLPISVKGTSKKGDTVRYEMVFQWTDDTSDDIHSFVNSIPTKDGGTHEAGYREGLAKAVRSYLDTSDSVPKRLDIRSEDIREGMKAIVNIFIEGELQFQSQNKVRLNNPEIKPALTNAVKMQVEQFLFNNTETAEKIAKRIVAAAKARQAARTAKKKITSKARSAKKITLPGKLSDCSSDDPSECEIFLVEGDSAGGCWSSSTRVSLADGRHLNFLELIEEQEQGIQNYCYTIKDDGTIGIEKILNVRKTKSNAKIVSVRLDNGSDLRCTPCHPFMLRDGTYKRADELTPTDSLMPLRLRKSSHEEGDWMKGYEMAFDPEKSAWVYVHHIADRYNRDQGFYSETLCGHRHHIDFNKLNNNPTNITRMPAQDHLQLHWDNLDKTLHSPETKALAIVTKRTPEFRQYMSDKMKEQSEDLSERAKKQWEDDDYKEFMNNAWKEFYESNEDYRLEVLNRLDKAQQEHWSSEENRKAQSRRTREYFESNPDHRENHKQLAKKQWEDEDLLEWRREETSKQWTKEFRKQRKSTLHKTYYDNTIQGLYQFKDGNQVDLQAYREWRISNKKKAHLKFETFVERYFDGKKEDAIEAVINYNHKIVSVTPLQTREDVYDLEVPGTHNFALSTGVFVHNSAKMGRNRETQAILPLRGKVLNTEGTDLKKVVKNKELSGVIEALGCGIGSSFDVNHLRYHKIILLMDADSDGHHITTLLLTFFYRHMPELIEGGYIYLAQPPLFRVEWGKERYWALSDNEKNKIIKKLEKRGAVKIDVSRFKGLGEMMADTLAETTLDPDSRVLIEVEIPDTLVDETDVAINNLMGKDASERYKMIVNNLNLIDDLDV